MIILNTQASQILKVIPRDYSVDFTVAFRDDTTNVIQEYFINGATRVGNYLQFTNFFAPILVENHFFDLSIFLDDDVWNQNFNLWQLDTNLWNDDTKQITDIYKDWIFCTNQTINQANNDYYQLNKGKYVAYAGFNNEYDPKFFIDTPPVYVTYNGSKNQYKVR